MSTEKTGTKDSGAESKEKSGEPNSLKGFILRIKEEIQSDESDHGFPVTLIIRYRDDIIRYSAMALGAVLIIAGIIAIIGSSERVVDNVVSGENTVIAAFLILTGLLLLGASMIHSIIGRTPLERLYKQVKSAERGEEEKDEK
ncbi:hypothetical protein [Methanothermobacter sp. K4]|uniref:hypothetical protein n=1 Tax=Methanothermobacter sp. K4 TaxID=2913262 RepID=UPI001EDA4F01|nr:hypothetical protein [Methanothermobacter sp. K4]MCG2828039.1 hypothetical protein [Methanothermobacter sp. K4]